MRNVPLLQPEWLRWVRSRAAKALRRTWASQAHHRLRRAEQHLPPVVRTRLCAVGGLLLLSTQVHDEGTLLPSVAENGTHYVGASASLKLDLRIPINDPYGAPGSVDGLAVDRAGRIFALDRRAKVVRVFDPAGRPLREIGGTGGGALQLSGPVGIAHDPLGRLWVVDAANGHYLVFDSTGAFVTSYPRRAAGYPTEWRGGFDGDGHLYDITFLTPPFSTMMLVRCSAFATECAVLPLPAEHHGPVYELRRKDALISATVPFTDDLVWRLDQHGAIWFGSSYSYRLIHRALGGDTLGILTHQYDRVPVTDADRAAAIAALSWFTAQGGTVDPAQFGRYKPIIDGISVDEDGRLWVQPVLATSPPRSVFDVFRPNGRYIARLQADVLVDPSCVPFVTRRALYGVTRSASGEVALVRLRIPSRSLD